MNAKVENEQAIQCAKDQVLRDLVLTSVEITYAGLYQKTEAESPELSVQGLRWYIELELRNLVDGTTAVALYRVWRDKPGTMKAVQVELLSGEIREDEDNIPYLERYEE